MIRRLDRDSMIEELAADFRKGDPAMTVDESVAEARRILDKLDAEVDRQMAPIVADLATKH